MKHTITTYNVTKGEKYSASKRAFQDVFEVHATLENKVGDTFTQVLATYATRANAERVANALTANASDLA